LIPFLIPCHLLGTLLAVTGSVHLGLRDIIIIAVAALMAKITEMTVSLRRDTVVRVCRSSGGRTRQWWKLAGIF
jgi:hypothetical protein